MNRKSEELFTDRSEKKFTLILSDEGIRRLPKEMQEELRTVAGLDCYTGYYVEVELYVIDDEPIVNGSYVLLFVCHADCADTEGIDSFEITNTLTLDEQQELAEQIIEKSYENICNLYKNADFYRTE